MEGLAAVLAKFHREVLLPDIERIVDGLRGEMNAKFDQVFGHFDAIDRRFDRFETKHQMVRTLTARLDD